jgi:hypothetical protein
LFQINNARQAFSFAGRENLFLGSPATNQRDYAEEECSKPQNQSFYHSGERILRKSNCQQQIDKKQ